jgi:DNA invertase Pin-like site-specific DNA recombinase
MTASIRCAIYTRKSSEEGLEQSFNSLDAQREACEAYIRSQRHEGWQALTAKYDDGGFSGGNTERPALKRLMADIQDGNINTVVVYKVDRLTRSLADFAKLVEQFDKMNISFVSVTQQFNTTTSMGRLTLNVLLSFAQFEREVTGERIRDKIAASKKRGMWMGGNVPLGYELRDRKLHIHPEEAATVRTIYSNYLRLGCVMALKDYLDQNGIRSKPRSRWIGTKPAETSFSRGGLYLILSSHIYVGEIFYKGTAYRGNHEAIIGREQWNQVQKLLKDNRQGKPRKARATKVSLFTGILFDEEGHRYTPTHASKGGRRYRYYTSQAVIRRASETEVPARIPAHDLEVAVTERIIKLLKTPKAVLGALAPSGKHSRGRHYAQLLRQASEKVASWSELSSGARERFLRAILERVVIHQDEVEISIRKDALIHQLAGKTAAQSAAGREMIALRCPFRHATKGKAVRLIVGDQQAPLAASTLAILKAIARARKWRDQIIAGEATGIRDLARIHKLNHSYVKRIYSFASFSPASIEAILNGEVPPDLSLDSLVHRIPLAWTEQGSVLASATGATSQQRGRDVLYLKSEWG